MKYLFLVLSALFFLNCFYSALTYSNFRSGQGIANRRIMENLPHGLAFLYSLCFPIMGYIIILIFNVKWYWYFLIFPASFFISIPIMLLFSKIYRTIIGVWYYHSIRTDNGMSLKINFVADTIISFVVGMILLLIAHFL